MIIDLRELELPSGRIEGVQEVAIAPRSEEAVSVSFRVVVDYSQSGGSIHLSGRVEGALDAECDRCLEPVRAPVEGSFDLVVRRSGEAEVSAAEEDTDEYVMLPLGEHRLSLERFVRETAVVSVPMVILCAENCRGLCPVCGANRNRETCRCQPIDDPRWHALRRLAGGGDKT